MDRFSKQQLQRSALFLTILGIGAVALNHNSLQAGFVLSSTQASSISIEAKPNKISTNTTEDKLFGNFSPQERETIEKEIVEQIRRYKDAGDNLRIERVLDWEKTTLQPILDLDVPPKDHQFWRELLSAIVYIESEGKFWVKSEAGAVGLAQPTEDTAKETAIKYRISNYNLGIGWDNLRVSRFLLQDLMERYNADISLLAYYGGPNFTDQKILEALQKGGLDKEESILKNGITSNQQLKLYINHFGINIFNLGSEDGMEYFTKTMAAMSILKEARTG